MFTVLAADVGAKLAAALISLLIIRILAPEEFSTYVTAVVVLGFVLQSFGTIFNRLYVVASGDKAHDVPAITYLVIQSVLGVFATTIVCLFLGLGAWILLLTCWLCLSMSASDFLKSKFQADLKFRRLAAVELARGLLFAAGLAAVFYFGLARPTAAAVIACQAGAASVAALPLLRALGADDRVWSVPAMRKLVLEVVTGALAPLYMYFFLIGLLASCDLFVLRTLSSPMEVAEYGSAIRYYMLLLTSLGAFNTVVLPMLKRHDGEKDKQFMISQHMRFVAVCVPAIALVAFSAPWWIPLVDGGKYPAAVPVFQVLAVSAVVSLVLAPWVSVLLVAGHYSFLAGLAAICLGLLVLSAWVLIGLLGILGAAIAVLVGYGTFAISTMVRARGIAGIRPASGAA